MIDGTDPDFETRLKLFINLFILSTGKFRTLNKSKNSYTIICGYEWGGGRRLVPQRLSFNSVC